MNSAPPGASLLVVDGVTRRHGTRTVLDGISFAVARGEVLALLGVNGAGKSTLLRLIAGVLAADTGHITIDGRTLADDPAAARRLIGWLPEHPPLYPELTVGEYLDFVAALRGIARADRARAIEDVLARLELAELANRLCGVLSKGQAQRVGLAQAIVHRPPLLLLDEPTSGLDPVQIERFHGLIGALRGDTAIVVSTHQLAEVRTLADRVAILHQGRLHDPGVPASDEAAITRRFLDVALGAVA
jgi:ABC-2 type transport system ATP-binding protein